MSESFEDALGLRGYRVHGRVQGVGFRWWTRSTADRLGLTGHVRNLTNGSVEVHAAGRPAVLTEFEGLLAEGPPVARVTAVERIEADSKMSRERFEVAPW